jgi:hypothetical protein
MDIEKTVERFLRATDEDEFDPGCLGLEFEKSGDISFDAVLRKLDDGQTSDAGRIRALRMLALLSRHFCVSRKPELIALSIRLMEHPDVRVRSAAVNTAVFTVSTMRRLRTFPQELAVATWERVREAVARAIQRGLASEQEALAHEFIASNGAADVTTET